MLRAALDVLEQLARRALSGRPDERGVAEDLLEQLAESLSGVLLVLLFAFGVFIIVACLWLLTCFDNCPLALSIILCLP